MASRQKILDVKVPRQAQDNWCWAAVAVGIRRAYEGAASLQCNVACRVLSLACCPAGVAGTCDVQSPLGPALGPHFVDPALEDDASRTFEFVKDQIDRGHPLAVRIAWRDGGSGHFVIISGYHETDEVQDLIVCDPYVGGRGVPVAFKQFRGNYHQLGSWDLTFKTAPDDGRRVPECDNDHLCP